MQEQAKPLTDAEVDAFLEQHKDDPVDAQQVERVRQRFNQKLNDAQVRERALREAAAVLDPYINGQRGPWSAYDIKEEIESLIHREHST